MTDVLSRAEKAINKLVELTQDGKLKWSVVNPSNYFPKDDIEGPVLRSKHDASDLILYRKAYLTTRGYVGNIGNIISSITINEEKEVKNYVTELSVCNSGSSLVIYTFPSSNLIRDLYNAAAYNAANIDHLLDSLLGNDNNDEEGS